jgi:hypothetical protein
MTKAATTVTEPTTITVAQGVVLTTTIDPQTKRHRPLCPPTLSGEPRTIWKYNTLSHLICEHPEPIPGITNTYKLPSIPGQLFVDMFTTQKEETWMGVAKEETVGYRTENELPESDDIEAIKAATKRERAETLSVVEPHGKKVKT